MMHDSRSMVGGSGAQVGRRQAWPPGTTGLSAGIHLQSQHEKRIAVVVCETTRASLCVRDKIKWVID